MLPKNVRNALGTSKNAKNKRDDKCKLTKDDFDRMLQASNKPQEDAADSKLMEPNISDKMQWPKRRPPSPTQEDIEAKLEAGHYLARAKQLQLEQEDEVKLANKVILATKCQAIRDAQLEEKRRIQSEMEAEEARLEVEMEAKRVEAIEKQARQREKQQQARIKYVKTLLQQVDRNERERHIAEEKALKESKKLREVHAQRDREEAAEARVRAQEQLQLRQELNRMNQTIQHRHVLEQAQEKMANLRIQQYMLGKAAREAEREERRQKLKQAQEREIARLRALQQRQQEVRDKAFVEAVERDQELVAKEWRHKELLAAKKRVQIETELREARVKQAEEKLRIQALELQREEDQIKTVLVLQAEALAKQEQQKIQHAKEVSRYREALQRQMQEKEERKRELRRQKEEDAFNAREEQEIRDRDLQGTLHLKVKELRNFKVPEKYVTGVERHLGLHKK